MASQSSDKDVVPSSPERGGDPSMAMQITLSGIRTQFPSVKQLSTENLDDLIMKNKQAVSGPGLVILDTRPEKEYHISHIEGAIRVDPDEGGESVSDVLKGILGQNSDTGGDMSQPKQDNQATVVCYCSIGYRSSIMAQKLAKVRDHQQKVTPDNTPKVKFYNLEGSLFKWANEQRPMVDHENKPTVYAHPYNVMFGKLLRSKLRKYPS